MIKEILRFEHVTYEKEGIIFLNGIHFNVYEGEIFGIISPSNHGKSELIELIQSNQRIQQGRILIDEEVVNTYKRAYKTRNKVTLIEHQSHLIDVLSIADNIFVMQPGFPQELIAENQLIRQLQPYLDAIGISLNPLELVENLSVFERLVVELLRAVVCGSRLIMINEIASILGQSDLKKYQRLLRDYTQQGYTFVYFCNHHEEAFQICDRLGIMEYGEMIKVLQNREFSDNVMKYFSFDFNQLSVFPLDDNDGNLLVLNHVACEEIRDVTFSLRAGECLVILDQNNTTLDSFNRLFTQQAELTKGQMIMMGSSFFSDERNTAKVSFIPQYPVETVLIESLSVLDNLLIDLKRKIPRFWNASRTRKRVYQEMKPVFNDYLDKQDISALDIHVLYQLVYYKTIVYSPRVVVITQPFSYADMYLRQDIIHLISEIKRRKIAVIILAVNIADSLFVAEHLLVVQGGCSIALYESSEFAHLRNKLER